VQFGAYEDSQHAEGEQQSEYAAGEAQQHAFQQQFAHNAAAPAPRATRIASS